MRKKIKSTKPTRDHDLAGLVGKKIKSISMEEIDILGTKENICQFYKIACSDGDVLYIGCNGGNDDCQYATATLYDQDEYDDFLESIAEDDLIYPGDEDDGEDDMDPDEDDEDDFIDDDSGVVDDD